jgi:hypothetical protein
MLADCQSVGMTMVRVDDAAENAWLLQEFTNRGLLDLGNGPLVFLGGTRTASFTWSWVDGAVFWDGSAVLYSNWSPGDPNGGIDCMGMTTDGTWVTRNCNSSDVVYACESRWF